MTLQEILHLPQDTVLDLYYSPENRVVKVIHKKDSGFKSSMISGGDHVDYLTTFISVEPTERKKSFYDYIGNVAVAEEEEYAG